MNEITVRNDNQSMSFEEMERRADVIAKSKLFPAWDTPEKVITLMLLAQAEGIPEIHAMQRYDNIKGNLTKKSSAALGDFLAMGGKIEWIVTTSEKATAKLTAPNGGVHEETYTLEDARRAGLIRPDSGWVKNPISMCRARVETRGIRAIWPRAMNMMMSTEEAVDEMQTHNGAMPTAKEKRVTAVIEAAEITVEPKTTPEAEVVEPEATPEPPKAVITETPKAEPKPAEPEKKPEPKPAKPTGKAPKAKDEFADVKKWLEKTFDKDLIQEYFHKITWGEISNFIPAQWKKIDDNRMGLEKGFGIYLKSKEA